MKPARALGLAATLFALVPSVAWSQTSGADEVDLKNGGMVRGTIVSIEPSKEVVILVQGTGEQRHVPWAEVARTLRGNQSAPPPPPPSIPVVREVVGPSDGTPVVHVRSESPIGLHEVVSSIAVVGYGGAAYGQISRQVCTSPCDRVVDGRAGQLFFFGGDGATQSSRFQLLGHGPDVTLDVRPGSVGMRVGGWLVLGLGVGAATLGATLIFLGGNATSIDSSGNVQTGTDSGEITGGAVATAIGGGLIIGGIVMLVKSVTHYDFVSAGAPQAGTTPLSFAF